MPRLRVRLVGADHYARQFERGAHDLRELLHTAVKNVGTDSELIFAAHARKKTGRMARNIRSTAVGDTAIVRVHARNPRTGYDYVGVTRFGHKLKWIEPTRVWPTSGVGKKLMRIPDVGWRWFQPAPALKTPFGFFRRVRGFHPAGDWAQKAMPQVRREAHREMDKLGEEFVLRLVG